MLRTSFHPTITHLGLAPVSSLLESVIVIPLAIDSDATRTRSELRQLEASWLARSQCYI